MNILEELSEMLIKFESMPFLFVGAGISRRYLDSENWEGLLRHFAQLANPTEFAYEIYKEEARTVSGSINNLPLIASFIERDFNKVWLSNESWEVSRHNNRELISKGISALKIEIAEHFKSKKVASDIDSKLEDEINLLKEISIKSIDGVITTNFDTFLESIMPNFKPFVGQEELLFSHPINTAEIYKIHGCCTRPETIIINQMDYENFNGRKAYLAAKLLTIFVEHPIIFLGYSIQDENIEQILESIINCLSTDNLKKIKNRLIFVEPSNGEGDKISTYNKSFAGGKSIEMTRMSTDDYSLIYKAISSNHRRYPTHIFRKLQEDLFKLVLTNDPTVKMRVVGITDDTSLEQIETVVGVGVFSEFGKKGYSSITAEEIFWDTVFNDKEYDNCLVVEETLPVLLKHHAGSLPIYKYLQNYTSEIPEIISREIKNEFNGLLSRTIRTNMQRSPLVYASIEEICAHCDHSKALRLIPMLGSNKINVDSLEAFLKRIFSNNPRILSTSNSNVKTDFRRVIKIYDWLRHYRSR